MPVEPVQAVGNTSRMTTARAVAETVWVWILLESVLWTPRSLMHSALIGLLALSPIWLSVRSGWWWRELGFFWPPRPITLNIIASGVVLALVFPVGAWLQGHSVPANPDWPGIKNIVPYFFWAFFQQFLLQSFIFLRMERVFGARGAVWASTVLFTIAHWPNVPLTALTFIGALYFTELFRRYRSILPLGVVHFLIGIAIAFSFPDSIMHHMRVGLSFRKF